MVRLGLYVSESKQISDLAEKSWNGGTCTISADMQPQKCMSFNILCEPDTSGNAGSLEKFI